MGIKRFSPPARGFNEREATGILGRVIRYLVELEKKLGYSFTEVAAQFATGSDTWNPSTINNGALSSPKTVTVPGAAVGDPAAAGFSSITAAGWDIRAIVTSADTVSVTLLNNTGGNVDLAEGTVRVVVWKVTS